MALWTAGAVGLVIAYLLGSVPTGYLAGKLLRGIDIREHGSESTGATNVLRALGKWPALAVLVGDVLKGVGAIVVARWFCPWLYAELSPMPTTAPDLQIWVPWAVCLAGIAVLVGHSRSIWLNLTGGKSAATGARRLAGDVVARGAGCCDGIRDRAGFRPDRFLELDARGVDGNHSRLRVRESTAVSVAGDRRRLLRDPSPPHEYSKTIGGDGAASGARWPRSESGCASLAQVSISHLGRLWPIPDIL